MVSIYLSKLTLPLSYFNCCMSDRCQFRQRVDSKAGGEGAHSGIKNVWFSGDFCKVVARCRAVTKCGQRTCVSGV